MAAVLKSGSGLRNEARGDGPGSGWREMHLFRFSASVHVAAKTLMT